jgi:hypothetical protein
MGLFAFAAMASSRSRFVAPVFASRLLIGSAILSPVGPIARASGGMTRLRMGGTVVIAPTTTINTNMILNIADSAFFYGR